ncbi:MAG: CCA tRNA nucleotidyltransferase [Planctomycetaceae bacterium]|nr:CCA tRNA nucleotidyltransferase [Planctomycetaceae bacterium]
MTAREFSISVIQRLREAGYTALWAGGCVRDLLMGRSPDDFDVATDATPTQVREVFGARRTLAVGESFGVIIVLGPKSAGQVEVATFRSEGEYHDGRRPSAVDFSNAQEDALRRDFTINGMFYDPVAEQVHDYVGGQGDLERRVIRAIGDAHARFGEDKLRLLRAVRFASLLDFNLEAETRAAVSQLASQIVIVSAERITQEFRKMLISPRRAAAMRLCRDVNLLPVILPEVQEHTIHFAEERWEEALEVLEQLGNASFAMALSVLLRHVPCPETWNRKEGPPHGTVPDVCQRLKLSNDDRNRILWLVQHAGGLAQAPSLSLAVLKRLAIAPGFAELLQLERTWARTVGQTLEPYDWLDHFLEDTPAEELNPAELLTGRDLIGLGYQPGPQFRDWLDAIRDAQLNNELSSRDQALTLLHELIARGAAVD